MKMQSKMRAIDKIYKRRDRYEIPDWQRQKVWSLSKKQTLIDTVLRGWKLPKFYFLKVSTDSYEVVDGQQRLVAIFEFFDGDLRLLPGTAQEFGGARYGELRDSVSDAFDDYEIEFDEIEDASEEEVKEFFQRLQEGLPLTSAEKLNSQHSKLRNFVSKQAKHQFFGKTNTSDRRYGHFDILAKVAAIEIEGIDVGLRYDDLQKVFQSQAHFSANSNVAKRLKAALDFAYAGFDDTAARVLRNRTIVQSLLTLVCRLLSAGNISGQEKRIAIFFKKFLQELNHQVELGLQATDPDYLDFQRTVNANIKNGPRIRQQILLSKLFALDPAFVDSLDPLIIAESGIQKTLASVSKQIVKLIGTINEKHSAQNGTDLFKVTNRTAQALARMGHPIRDFKTYKGFIDNLYFLFHEGVGRRLDRQMPSSFEDVNKLRTGLQHDLDHGKGREVKAKRKQIGNIFKKYAGVPSPEGLAPERFVIVQLGLLGALKGDLHKLEI